MNPNPPGPSPAEPDGPVARPTSPSAPTPPAAAPGRPLSVSLVRKTTSPSPGGTTPAGPGGSFSSSPVAGPAADRTGVVSPLQLPGVEAPASAPAPPAELVAPRQSPWDRLAARLAAPALSIPTTLACLGLLTWSLAVRRNAHPIVVNARATPIDPAGAPTGDDVTALSARVAEARKAMADDVQLPRVISALEQRARAAGFAVEVTTSPPTSPIPGLPALVRHPFVFKLSNNTEEGEPAFVRLLAWMRAAVTLGIKVDPGAVTVQSPGRGLGAVSVELGIFTWTTDAKAPAE